MGCNSPGQGRWAEQVKGVTPLQERLQEAVEAMGVERCCWEEWLCCWLNLWSSVLVAATLTLLCAQ